MTQLTSKLTCQRKHTYYKSRSASNARARRNKRAGYDYLRSYKCNVCNYWHLTTQYKERREEDDNNLNQVDSPTEAKDN